MDLFSQYQVSDTSLTASWTASGATEWAAMVASFKPRSDTTGTGGGGSTGGGSTGGAAGEHAPVAHSASVAANPATVVASAAVPGTSTLTVSNIRDNDGTLVPDGTK